MQKKAIIQNKNKNTAAFVITMCIFTSISSIINHIHVLVDHIFVKALECLYSNISFDKLKLTLICVIESNIQENCFISFSLITVVS